MCRVCRRGAASGNGWCRSLTCEVPRKPTSNGPPRHPLGCRTPWDPELHADAFDAKVSAELDAGTYVDPASGETTFEAYAEAWRTARTHGETTGINVEHQFRLHVYSNPGNPGRSKRGGPAGASQDAGPGASAEHQPAVDRRHAAGRFHEAEGDRQRVVGVRRGGR